MTYFPLEDLVATNLILNEILAELQKMNQQLEIITDEDVEEEE